MKKLLTFSVILLSSLGAFITFTNETNKDNGRAGNTGSPGESTCQTGGCHTGTANTGPGSVTITSSDMTDWEYVPGTTYNIRVSTVEAGKTIFGLGVEALNSSNTDAGTINVTDAARTKILTATNGRTNLVHQTDGGLSNDSAVFNFSWTAPSTDIGNVTFYVAGNCCNNSNSFAGDNSYTTSRVCTAKTNVGIKSVEANQQVNIYPNPVTDQMNIELNDINMQKANISLVDMSGKVVAVLASNVSLEANTKLSLDRPSSVHMGVYYLIISNDSNTKLKKIIVQ